MNLVYNAYMSKIMRILFGTAALFFGVFLLSSTAANAITTTTTASGYPGPTTTIAPQPAVVNVNLGSFSSGKSFTVQSSGFQPGSQVTVTFGGNPVGTFTADSSGNVTFTVDVTSVNSTGGTVTINGKSFNVALSNNVLVAVGTGANGAALTVNNSFSLASSGSLAFTGINLAKWLGVVGVLLVIGFVLFMLEKKRSVKTKA